jgi:hypothetical protein
MGAGLVLWCRGNLLFTMSQMPTVHHKHSLKRLSNFVLLQYELNMQTTRLCDSGLNYAEDVRIIMKTLISMYVRIPERKWEKVRNATQCT